MDIERIEWWNESPKRKRTRRSKIAGSPNTEKAKKLKNDSNNRRKTDRNN